MVRRPFEAEQTAISTFWALKDLDLDVERGRCLGIIGRNGAGKSTLLKVLSRITPPTTGRAEIFGRLGTLLEVGTGFHPELTGRENIYLNGTILGMKRAEIDRKFDEIVAFSEVERFLDTPVKRYSSGMYVRLAFGVAAHLESEILVVDEVLAVGDAGFQSKCLRKMEDVARNGRTVLFVSHNMAALQSLCDRLVWLEDGSVKQEGDPAHVIGAYLKTVSQGFEVGRGRGDEDITLERVVLRDVRGVPSLTIAPGDGLEVEVHFSARSRIPLPHFWIGVGSQYGPLLGANMLLDGFCPEWIEGRGTISCRFESLPLLPQLYTLQVGARGPDGTTRLMETREVGFFSVAGSLGGHGYAGAHADANATNASPVVTTYTWQLPDGRRRTVALKPATSD
jgi:lipopolysaccharide transport system ATP-binding protein